MAQNQYISLKVTGRPDENGGYNPLILFNNPAFEVKDQDYVGFENNSFFYSIKDSDKYTVFKLVKNNVRAYNGFRLSTIKIAFSIPKGYRLDNNITPYDVLNTLKDVFLSKCLRCVDTQKDTYEYTSNRIDASVLDETVKKFSISQGATPNLKMNPQLSIGYIVKSDRDIEQLFRDFYYPEFGNYSEIIVAESVNQTSYTPITNIQIPRPKSYSVFVDGKLHGSYTNLNESIIVASTEPLEFYENKKVSFTIQNLLDNDFISASGIEFDEGAEMVNVSTKEWAKPKHRKIELHIVPKDYENYILTHSNLISITWPFGEIKLDQDFSFTLIGEQIAEIKRNSIKFALKPNDRYKLVNYDIYGDELRATVSEIRPSVVQRTGGAGQHRYQQQERVTDLQVIKTSPVYDVSILLGDKAKFVEGNEIDVKLKTHPESSNLTLATCRTKFKALSKSNDAFEGHFYVPKDLPHPDLYLCFQINEKSYITKQPLFFSNEKAVVEEKDFVISYVEPFYKRKNFLIKLSVPILALLLGYVIGYASHNGIKRLLDGTNPSSVTTDAFDGEGGTSMTEEQAIDFLEDADAALKSKDLKFSKVEDIYNKYKEFKTIIDSVDKKQFGNKVCARIIDYNKVTSYVTNGNVEELKNALDSIQHNNFHVWKIHADILKQIVNNETTIEQFHNNYSTILAFDQISSALTPSTFNCEVCGNALGTEAELAEHKKSHSTSTTYDCDICLAVFESRSKLNKHKLTAHPTARSQKNHYSCPQCGPDMWFESQEKLDIHLQTNHER